MKNKKFIPIFLVVCIAAVIAVGGFLLSKVGSETDNTAQAPAEDSVQPEETAAALATAQPASTAQSAPTTLPAQPATSSVAPMPPLEPASAISIAEAIGSDVQPTVINGTYHYEGNVVISEKNEPDTLSDYDVIALVDGKLVSDYFSGNLDASKDNWETMETGLWVMDSGEKKHIENTYERWTAADGGLVLQHWTADSNGTLYIVYGNDDAYPTEVFLRIIGKNGDILADKVPFEFSVASQPSRVRQMKVYGDRIYTIDGRLMIHINTFDGKQVKQSILPLDEQVHDIEVDPNGGFYILSYASVGASLEKYNLNEDKRVYSVTVNCPNAELLFYDEANNSINLVSNTQIMRADARNGRNAAEEVNFETDIPYVPGHYSTGGDELVCFATDAAGSIYISIANTEGYLIYKLTQVPGGKADREAETELTVTAVYKHPFIEEAAARYAKERPDVMINWDVLYQTYSEGRAALLNGNAYQTFLTKIMANDVGDVIDTGSMSVSTYDILKTDVFTDLSDFIKQDKSYPDLNKASLDSLLIDGQIKGLPLGLETDYIVLDKALWNKTGIAFDTAKPLKWSDIMQLAADNPAGNNEAFFSAEQNYVFAMIVLANFPDLIDIEQRTVNLKQDWFIDLIENYKEIVNIPNLFADENADYSDAARSLFYFEENDSFAMPEAYIWGDANGKEIIPFFEGEQNRNAVLRPVIMYSIGTNSTKQNEAWAFLSFMLEADQQALGSLDVTPVNFQAIQRGFDMHGNEYDEYRDRAVDFMSRIDYAYQISHYPYDITEPVMRYINGELTLDEALDIAEQNVEFRLNE